MAKKKEQGKPQPGAGQAPEVQQPEAQQSENPAPKAEQPKPEKTEAERAQEALAKEHDQYLRLAAEYDNFRKRSQREKDALYQDAVADTSKKFLPVYDNLERALKNETADEAYKRGVEMTMNELIKIFESFQLKPFGAAGETFDPQRHNAVMHVTDEALGENVIAEVFQTGFAMGERIIRFAMVKVAN